MTVMTVMVIIRVNRLSNCDGAKTKRAEKFASKNVAESKHACDILLEPVSGFVKPSFFWPQIRQTSRISTVLTGDLNYWLRLCVGKRERKSGHLNPKQPDNLSRLPEW